MATKVSEKLFWVCWIQDDPPFFEIIKDRLVGLMMTGEELAAEEQRIEELSKNFCCKRTENIGMNKNELQSIRARVLYGLRSLRADSEIAKLAGLEDEWYRDEYLPHKRFLLEQSYLFLNSVVKEEISKLVRKQRAKMKPENVEDSLKTMVVTEEQQENKMSQMTEFEKEYQQHVLQWAHDRNIIEGSDVMRQLLKTCTEAGEMVDAARKGDIDEYVDSIGDQWVTIVIGMEMSGVSYQDALDAAREIDRPASTDDIVLSTSLISDGMLKQDKYKLCQGYGEYLSILRGLPVFVDGVVAAWGTIKDRKGKMVNGVFVKESDLKDGQ